MKLQIKLQRGEFRINIFRYIVFKVKYFNSINSSVQISILHIQWLIKLKYLCLSAAFIQCHFICPKYIAISGTLQIFGFQNTFTGKTL